MDDVRQDAYVFALELSRKLATEPLLATNRVTGKPVDPEKWLYVRVLGKLKDFRDRVYPRLGQHRRTVAVTDPSVLESTVPADHVPEANGELLVQLKDSMGLLTKKQREVVSAYYFDRLTQRDIAVARGITQKSVHILLRRGLKRLRKIWEADDAVGG